MIQKPRVVYDGVCNLCTAAVRFLNVIDRRRTIEYASFQELDRGVRRKYGMTDREFQGRMHLIRWDDSIMSGAAAITEICKLLAPFKFVCNLLNNSFADRVYDFIASRRYSLFGCRESCFVVRDGERSKIRVR